MTEAVLHIYKNNMGACFWRLIIKAKESVVCEGGWSKDLDETRVAAHRFINMVKQDVEVVDVPEPETRKRIKVKRHKSRRRRDFGNKN